jgi:hypothetical protein
VGLLPINVKVGFMLLLLQHTAVDLIFYRFILYSLQKRSCRGERVGAVILLSKGRGGRAWVNGEVSGQG